MDLDIFIIFIFTLIPVVVGLLVLGLMIRIRAPHEGIRHWVKQSRESRVNWKERPFAKGRPGVLQEVDFVPGAGSVVTALGDVENLQQEAGRLKDKLVKRSQTTVASLNKESPKPSLPPSITPRPKATKWKAVNATPESSPKSADKTVENPQ